MADSSATGLRDARSIVLALIGVLACLPSLAAAPAGIEAIAAYAGSWKSDITHLQTPYSKASHETTRLRNDCWRSGEFYTCHQYVDGDSKASMSMATPKRSWSSRTTRSSAATPPTPSFPARTPHMPASC